MGEAHELQDWMFEESRTSLEILEKSQPRRSVQDLLSDLGRSPDESSSSDEDPGPNLEDDGSVTLMEQPSEVVQGAQEPPRRSRQAARRQRNRQNNPPTVSRKDNLTKGRVREASKRSVQTDVTISSLRPGLKFEDGEAKVYKLDELLEAGFTLVEWGGV